MTISKRDGESDRFNDLLFYPAFHFIYICFFATKGQEQNGREKSCFKQLSLSSWNSPEIGSVWVPELLSPWNTSLKIFPTSNIVEFSRNLTLTYLTHHYNQV